MAEADQPPRGETAGEAIVRICTRFSGLTYEQKALQIDDALERMIRREARDVLRDELHELREGSSG